MHYRCTSKRAPGRAGRLPALVAFLLVAWAACLAAEQAPAPTVSPAAVRQGGLVRVTWSAPEGRRVAKATIAPAGGEPQPAFVEGRQVIGLFAVPAKTKPGSFSAALTIEYEGGETARLPVSVRVVDAHFQTQHIRMPKSKTGLMSESILEKERNILYGAMKGTAAEPLWHGTFVLPAPGRISSPYGKKRYVNGRFWGQHSGLDVAAGAGTPIHAVNAGRVLVARKLWMRGNTVMIDHGMGIFSLYNHMSRIDVKVGQKVERGQRIGLVGATGFVTGPHLHWEMRSGRTPLNPAGPLKEGIPLGE